MILPLEDDFSDILSKAQKGLGVSTEDLAERCGVGESLIRAVRKGDYDAKTVAAIAGELGLNVAAVARIGEKAWQPRKPEALAGFAMVSSPFHSWQVNAFLAWDVETKRAVAFDTGTDTGPMVDVLKDEGLELEAIILTHAHWDHAREVGALKRRWPAARVFIGAQEDGIADEAEKMAEGFRYQLGRLRIDGFDTPGHTAGGMSFAIEGLDGPVAVVGDALFAGSMGGANVSYASGVESVRRLLALGVDTVLAPGHGPMSTVGEERGMNAFFVGGV